MPAHVQHRRGGGSRLCSRPRAPIAGLASTPAVGGGRPFRSSPSPRRQEGVERTASAAPEPPPLLVPAAAARRPEDAAEQHSEGAAEALARCIRAALGGEPVPRDLVSALLAASAPKRRPTVSPRLEGSRCPAAPPASRGQLPSPEAPLAGSGGDRRTTAPPPRRPCSEPRHGRRVARMRRVPVPRLAVGPSGGAGRRMCAVRGCGMAF